MELITRCKKMIDELGIPVTRFCGHTMISHSTFYEWCKGTRKLSEITEKRINDFLTKYGF